MIVPLYKDKGERTECSNYRCISLLSMTGKICAGNPVDRVHKVTEGLIDDKQLGVQSREGVCKPDPHQADRLEGM